MAATHADVLFDRFADDALYAYWDGNGDETEVRSIARGPDEIARVLEMSGAGRLEPLVALEDGRNRFVEGRLAEPAATFVAAMQLDADGAITRCLSFHCTPVEPPAVSAEAAPGDALAILERYFRHLVAGELAEACECFSGDCLYSHPPYVPGGPRVEFRGREELLEGFRTTRGPRSSRPEIICCVQRGADCFIEGVVDARDGPKGSFVSTASLDADGLIHRYVAFYTSSRVPRR
jgi:hypothetical protein